MYDDEETKVESAGPAPESGLTAEQVESMIQAALKKQVDDTLGLIVAASQHKADPNIVAIKNKIVASLARSGADKLARDVDHYGLACLDAAAALIGELGLLAPPEE